MSRAITPGGKLLGLSSTKKLIATLHYVPLNLKAAAMSNQAAVVEMGDVDTGLGGGGGGASGGAVPVLKLWEMHRTERGMQRMKDRLASKKTDSRGVTKPRLECSATCQVPDTWIDAICFLDR